MDQTQYKKSIPEERYKLELHVRGKDLLNLDTFSKSDPYCRLLHTIYGEKEVNEGDTEWLKNNLNPQWEKTFVIDYIFELNQDLIFQIWDHNASTGSSDELIGSAKTTVADIVGSKDMTIDLNVSTKKGKPAGQLHVVLEKLPEENTFLQMHWAGIDLMNTDGFFGKSDPFLRFNKKIGEEWIPVHSTEMIKDNLNPDWKPFQISVRRLCNGVHEQKFRVECWDVHEKGANNQYMGFFEVSVHDIINENKKEFQLDYKPGQSGGKIVLKEHKLIRKPSFMDFLKDGEQINMIIGIDYTAQNGNQQFPDSLHAFVPNSINAYETAMKCCGQVLLNYDYDKKVAIYGFGAIPHLPNYNSNETSQCFPLTGDFKKPEVFGLEGLMNLYKQTIGNLQFSGPGCLGDIITYAKQISEFNAKKKIYTVLLILTCGQIHDLHKTTEILSKCATVPLSVILVGVGDYKFDKLELLDQEQKGLQSDSAQLTRNVVQFVPFKQFSHSLPILQRELLAELPHQLTSYKSIVGLSPSQYY